MFQAKYVRKQYFFPFLFSFTKQNCLTAIINEILILKTFDEKIVAHLYLIASVSAIRNKICLFFSIPSFVYQLGSTE